MDKLINFFIVNHKLTIVLSIGIMIMGFLGIRSMNSESYPNVDFAMAIVTTRYDGASAKEIETKITKPIEDEIRTVSGLKDVRSVSQAGLSTIYIRADIDNIVVEKVMNDLQKAVDRVSDLPSDLKDPPSFNEINSEEFPVVEIAIIGKNDLRQRDLVADHLKEELEDDDRIKNVRLVGFHKRRFNIYLNQKKLQANYIGIDEVTRKIQGRNINVPGGSLESLTNQRLVQVEGKIKDVEQLKNILIRSNLAGKQILLKDIARVEDGKDDIDVYASYNGAPATLAIINKKGGTDTISLVDKIQSRLNEFEERNPEMKFAIYHNESLKVKNKLDVLSSNAVSGLILVILFLFLFLPGRIGILASLSLPLAVLAILGIMPYFGMNLNAITILALVIALGMLVDNSVVISEHFSRLRQEGLSSTEAAKQAVSQLWLPITATAFTTIAAFLPMLVTKGIMGQFIKWIPIVVSSALIISLIESFFLLPMRLAKGGGNVKPRSESGESNDWFGKFETKFEKLTTFCVGKRYFIALIFFITLGFSFFLMGVANKFILFPAEQTEIYIARVNSEPGTPIEQTSKFMDRLSQDIKTEMKEDIEHIVSRAGTAQVGASDPKAASGDDVGMLSMYVNDETKFNIPHTQVLKRLRKITAPYLKNVEFEAQINGPPIGNPIEATFRSNDDESLNQLLNKLKSELAKTPGVYDLKINEVFGEEEVLPQISYEKTDQLGLSVNDIGQTIRTAMSGKVLSTVTLLNKQVDLFLRLDSPYRVDLDDLKTINIMDKAGNLVPLSSLASFDSKAGTPFINRYDFKRSKVLTGNVEENKITAIAANQQLMKIYEQETKKYPDVSMVFGGMQESTNESMQSLADALVLSLIGIFALLVFIFGSYLRPAIIMTTIPLGLLGFSIAFYLHDRPISFMSLIGIIGLGGIIVNSGIILISFIDQLKSESKIQSDPTLAYKEKQDDLHRQLVRASGMRLRAVVVTSLTTISGLIPTAYGIGGSDSMLIPMTLAMAWGLTSGTILTLIWVPCAYAILEDFTYRLSKISSKTKTHLLGFIRNAKTSVE